jgi:Cobalamin biosynthesis protein CbiG
MLTIITISPRGTALALKLKSILPETEIFTLRKYAVDQTACIDGDLGEAVGELFKTRKKLLFIMAAGIVVRNIAPYIGNKTTDPAVVVMDERGNFAISLLSGHLGGANELASELEKRIGVKAVITTASDVNGKTAVDMFAKTHDLVIDNMADAKELTAMLIQGKNIAQQNDTLAVVASTYSGGANADALVLITHKKRIEQNIPTVKLFPKNLILGVGCRKHVAGGLIISFITRQLEELNIDSRCICLIASVDIKAEEPGIQEAAAHFGVPFTCVGRTEIEKVEGRFSASPFVKEQIGVSGVCEPAAFIAGGGAGRFLLRKTASNGITLAIFEKITNP